ncbi:MAG TPA: hypothetical protein VFC10_11390 [Terriglobia bacterium]|nr:hypothetical protein [Terriglobia bacterium]
MSAQIKYLGFQLSPKGRDYTYRVVDAKEGNRDFVLSITNQAFAEHHVPYQDAAAICYQKLQKALDTESDSRPVPHHYVLSGQELDEYMGQHRPARSRGWRA